MVHACDVSLQQGKWSLHMCVHMYAGMCGCSLCRSVSLSIPSSSVCMGPGRWLGFSVELISGCLSTGAPKGELECWPLMGTPGPTAGDCGLSLTHPQ